MDRLTDEVRQESPWTMMFADDIVICSDVDAARSEGQDVTSVGSSIFSKSCLPMGLICGFAFLIVGLLIAVAVYYKYGRNRNNKGNGNKDVEMDKLMKNMKMDLEKSRNEIKVQVDELEGHREENKKSLQSVEKEIKEKETTVDKPEKFLREKEKLLNEQWRQDQRKKDLEKQLLDYEKLLEPIEIFIGRDTALIR
ncbi:hypothetical protein Q5P01_002879 [Channa striata]|uniref:Uncharacterized protein n=1 Tax=Channa striata TaxID=64152 RepID=A0AA88NNC2_CHASR|nr:hypothetical protein Q5P01_002879 [Channa striata]